MASEERLVPVRVYQTKDRIMLAAPMPGLEPEDIRIALDGRHVTVDGRERGPHQHERDLIMTEWTLGPYHREVRLPEPVDGRLANATYDNGVLVLSMPKLASGEASGRVEIHLESIECTRGEHVGHVGREIRPTTTTEHRSGKHAGVRHRPASVDARTAATAPAATAAAETEPRAVSGYAHVNIWRLDSGDDPSDTSAANVVGERLRGQPGFRSYTVVRTAEHEVVAVTVFDSEPQLRSALAAVADVVRSRVRPLAVARPERRQGPILHHEAIA